MTALYKVPLEIDPDYSLTEVIDKHSTLIITWHEDAEYIDITGNMNDLADFFQALDGPAQSFPIDEFKEWASQYEVDENGIPV